jgi:RNA polymerase sigma-70 factor, ECF subfamily
MDDADLVKEFRRGNREAFSQLVSKYSRPLTMMILKLVRDEDEARDISQTAFLRAYQGFPRFNMASSFKTWLYSIALNAARDHLRRRKPMLSQDTLPDLPDPVESAGEQLDKFRNVERLRSAIAELPEKQRLTVQLRIYEEMDYEEIAEILGGTAAGARGNFFQAAKTLREKLRSIT